MDTNTLPSLDDTAFVDTYDCVFKHPKTKAVITTVTLASPSHPQSIEADEIERRESYAKPANPDGEETVAESRVRNIKYLARRIITSTPFTVGGEAVTLSPTNAAGILLQPKYGALLGTLIVARAEQVNFMPNSALAS